LLVLRLYPDEARVAARDAAARHDRTGSRTLLRLAGRLGWRFPESLGACALYLFRNGKDTLYRTHGTNEPETIGKAVLSAAFEC